MQLRPPLLSFALAFAVAGAAWAGDKASKASDDPRQRSDGISQRDTSSAQSPTDAPDGFVIFQERLVYVLANEPQLHLTSALAKMAQDDNRGAAEEVRIAANYIEMQGGRGKGDVSTELSKSADGLRQLADKIESGQMKDAKKLSSKFAKANLALARHHDALAKSFLDSGRYVAAGHDLEAAAQNFRQALAWSDQPADTATSDVIDNALHVAANLQTEAVAREMRDDTQPGEAQPAGARQDPRTGTSEAEAKNIAEHAQKVCGELSKQIDQFSTKIQSSTNSDEKS